MSKHPDAGELADEFGMTIHYGREDKVAEREGSMSERPFHELNLIGRYAEHILWVVDHYSLPKKAEEKLRLTADVLRAESKVFEALEQRVEGFRTEMLNQLRQAVDTRDGVIEAFGEFGLILRAPVLIWKTRPPRDDDEAVLFMRANGMTLAEIDTAGKRIAALAEEALAEEEHERPNSR